MISRGFLSDPVFAFYFGKFSVENDKSELTLGGVNEGHFSGDLVSLPLRQKPPLELELNALTFSDETVMLIYNGASVDIRASMIMLPSSLTQVM